jgi:YD repeat-containing protein
VGTHEDDHRSVYLYNNRSQRIGSIDPEGYLTENRYDAAGNVETTTRYSAQLTNYNVGASIDDLRPQISGTDAFGAPIANRVTSFLYDAQNRLIESTKYEGTKSQFEYDSVGNLIETTNSVGGTGQDAERTLSSRYDTQGRLIATLPAQGKAALDALKLEYAPLNPPQNQIDEIWAEYGNAHTYDVVGRRTSTTDQWGNTTYFFYNSDNQLRFSVNAMGEVKENRYNVFGEIEFTIAYTNRLNEEDLNTLQTIGGGLLNTLTDSLVTPLADPDKDNVTHSLYDLRGAVSTAIDGMQFRSEFSYNAFGELKNERNQINQSAGAGYSPLTDANGNPVANINSVLHKYSYDRRGLLTKTIWDADPGGKQTSNSTLYDAFGSTRFSTDARAKTTEYIYDKRGRAVEIRDPRNAVRKTTYDAFDRLLTQTDALNNTTRYQYDDTRRYTTVISPEGARVRTIKNAHGEVWNVDKGVYPDSHVVNYRYDLNGNVDKTSYSQIDELSVFDNGNLHNRLYETYDGKNNVVRFEYDEANRLTTRIVDPEGLDIETRYEYDGQGRLEYTIEAAGTIHEQITQFVYDANDQLVEQIVDPDQKDGARDYQHLVTRYVYDAQGNTLLVTTGFTQHYNPGNPDANVDGFVDDLTDAKVTSYIYDNLGRRSAEIVAPSGQVPDGHQGLDLLTSYHYDNNDNVIAKIDAEENITRYVYDDNDNLIYTIDPEGGVSKTEYDLQGNVTRLISYAYPVSFDGFPPPATPLTDDLITLIPRADDRDTRFAYDNDNRLVFTLQMSGVAGRITEKVYDARGNVIKEQEYAPLVSFPNGYQADDVRAELAKLGNNTKSRSTHFAYDSANRLVFEIDALGYVKQYTYDAASNITRTVRYSEPVDASRTWSYWEIYGEVSQFNHKSQLSLGFTDYGSLEDLDYPKIADDTSVAFNDNGDGVLVWRQLSGNSNIHYNLYARLYSKETGWQDAIPLENRGQTIADNTLDVEIDNEGNVLATWGQGAYLNWARFDADVEAWEKDHTGFTVDNSPTELVMDSEGNAIAIWSNGYDIRYAKYTKGNGWGPREVLYYSPVVDNVQQYSFSDVRMSIDENDRAVAVWTTTYLDGTVEIKAKEYTSDTGWVNSNYGGYTLSAIDGNASAISDIRVKVSRESGALITWKETTGNNYNIYSVFYPNDVNENLNLDLPQDKTLVAQSTDSNLSHKILFNGRGDAIIAWADHDNGINAKRYLAGEPGGGWQEAELISAYQNSTSWYSYEEPLNITKNTLGNFIVGWTGDDGVFYSEYITHEGWQPPTATGDIWVNKLVFTQNREGALEFVYETFDFDYAFFEIHGKTIPTRQKNYSVYDAANRLKYAVDAYGGVTEYIYDGNGNVTKRIAHKNPIDPALAEHPVNAYQNIKDALEGADPQNQYSRNFYDRANRLRFTIDAMGYATEFQYRNDGNISKTLRYEKQLLLNFNNSFTADQISEILAGRTFTPPAKDQITEYVYDEAGRVKETIQAEDTDIQYSEYFAYDKTGNVIRQTNGNGDHTYFRYDAMGRVIRKIDGEGYVVDTNYDALGKVQYRITYMQQVTLPQIDDPDWAYSLASNPVTTLDSVANGEVEIYGDRTEIFIYDAFGRIKRKTDPAVSGQPVVVTQYNYDGFGNLTDTIQAQGLAEEAIIHREYDLLGQVTSESFGYGSIDESRTVFEYDAFGNQTAIIDPRGYALVYSNNSFYQQERIKLGHVVNTEPYYIVTGDDTWSTIMEKLYGWPNAGNLLANEMGNPELIPGSYLTSFPPTIDIQWWDGSVIVRTLDQTKLLTQRAKTAEELSEREIETLLDSYKSFQTFDLLNRKVSVTDPYGNATATTYDSFGNIAKVTDPNGSMGFFFYDQLNRQYLSIDPEGAATQLIYDAYGNVEKTIRYANKVHGDFDETSAIHIISAGASVPAGPYIRESADDQITVVEFDELNRKSAITDAESFVESFNYDNAGNVVSYKDKNGNIVRYEYDANGNKTAEIKPNDFYIPEASPEEDIKLNNVLESGRIYDPNIVYDDNGNGLAVWSQQVGDIYKIYASRYDVASGWQDQYQISENGGTSHITDQAIVFDKNGNALVVWTQEIGGSRYAYSRSFSIATGWSQTADKLSADTKFCMDVKVALDADGNGMAIWSQGDSATDDILDVYYRRYIGTEGWTSETAEIDGTEQDTEFLTTKPQLGIDKNGNAIVVWGQRNTNPNQWARDIYANVYIAGESWTGPELLGDLNGTDSTNVKISVNENGQAMAVWQQWTDSDGFGIFGKRYEPGSGWETDVVTLGDPAGTGGVYPNVAIDDDGNILVAWGRVSRYYDVDSGWGDTIHASSAVYSLAKLVHGPDNKFYTIFYDKYNNNRAVFVNQFTKGIGWGNPQLVVEDTDYQYSNHDFDIGFNKDGSATVLYRDFGAGEVDKVRVREIFSEIVDQHEYDAVGNKISTTQAVGMANRLTEYKYDKENRLVKSTNPETLTAQENTQSGVTFSVDPQTRTIQFHGLASSTHRISFWYKPIADDSAREYVRLPVYNNTATIQLATSSDYIYDYQAEIYDINYELLDRFSGTLNIVNQTASIDHDSTIAGISVLTTERNVYDAKGNLVIEIDGADNEIHHYYDVNGLRIATLDAERYFTRFFYDAGGKLVESRSYENRIPTTQDSQLPLMAKDPDSYFSAQPYRAVYYRLDANGNIIETTTKAVYSYARNEYSDIAPLVENNYYDKKGNQIRYTDADGNTTYYFYDDNGQKRITVDPLGYAERFDYDAFGNVRFNFRYARTLMEMGISLNSESATNSLIENLNMEYPHPDDRVVEYGYDRLNQLISKNVHGLEVANIGTPGDTHVLEGGWQNPELLSSEDVGFYTEPTIASDDNGNAFAIWTEYQNLYMSVFDAVTNTWREKIQIASDLRYSHPQYDSNKQYANIAVSRDGDVQIVWLQNVVNDAGQGELAVFSRSYNADTGSLSNTRRLDNSANKVGYDVSQVPVPKITMLENGKAMAIWVEYVQHPVTGALPIYEQMLYASIYDANTRTWSTPVTVGPNYFDINANAKSSLEDFQVISDENGKALINIRYQFNTPATDSERQVILSVEYDGTWHPHEVIVDNINSPLVGVGDLSTNTIATAMNSAGDGVAAWIDWDSTLQQYRVFANRFDHNNGWSNTADPISVSMLADEITDVQVDIGDDGDIYVVWTQRNGTKGTANARKYTKSTNQWSFVHPLVWLYSHPDNYALNPRVVATDQGSAYITWTQVINGNGDGLKDGVYIYAKSYSGSGFWADSITDPMQTGTSLNVGNSPVAVAIDKNGDLLTLRTQKNATESLAFPWKKYTTIAQRYTQSARGNSAHTPVKQTVTTRYEYDGNGNLRFIRDPGDIVTEYRYDSLNQLAAQIQPMMSNDEGRATKRYQRNTYDSVGNLIKFEDFDSASLEKHVTRYDFDAFGDVISESNPENETTLYFYDKNHNQTHRLQTQSDFYLNSRKLITEYQYDNNHRLVRTIDAEGYNEQVEYNAFGQIVRKGRDKGITTRYQVYYEYDDAGRLIKTNRDGVDVVYLYDKNGNMTAEIQSGKTDVLELVGRSLRQLDLSTIVGLSHAEVSRKENEYDGRNQLIATHDAPIRVTDEPFYVVYAEDMAAPDEDSRWDNIVVRLYGGNDPVNIGDANKIRRLALKLKDSLGAPTLSVDLELRVPGYLFDDQAAGGQAYFKLDYYQLDVPLLYYQKGYIDNYSITKSYTYNAFGDLESIVDGKNNRTEYKYDKNGQIKEQILPETSVTAEDGSIHRMMPAKKYFYDAMGRQIGVIDANGNVTFKHYDDAGNLLGEYYADGGVKQYGYDAFGNMRYMENENNARTLYRYDNKNQLVEITRPTGSTFGSAARWELFNYDEMGNRIGYTTPKHLEDGRWQKTYFDGIGRIVKSVSFEGRTTEYTYDYNNATDMNIIHTRYDGFNHDTNVSTFEEHDYFDRLRYRRDMGDRSYRHYYNEGGWLSYIVANTRDNSDTAPGGIVGEEANGKLANPFYISEQAFRPDASGNVPGHPEIEYVEAYEYYNNGLLLKREAPYSSATSPGGKTFKYDKNGNVRFDGVIGTLSTTGMYAHYDELDRLVYANNPYSKLLNVSYEYDANGNKKAVKTNYKTSSISESEENWYRYDERNRLITKGVLSGFRGVWNTTVDHLQREDDYYVTYDMAGNRQSKLTATGVNRAYTIDRYFYNEDNKLHKILKYTQDHPHGYLMADKSFDVVGNEVRYYMTNGQSANYSGGIKIFDYDGLMIREVSMNDGPDFDITYDYNDLGQLTHILQVQTSPRYSSVDTYYSYEYWDNAKQRDVRRSVEYGSGFSKYRYTPRGYLGYVDDVESSRFVYYTHNLDGQITSRSSRPEEQRQIYYYFGGIGITDYGDDGLNTIDYSSFTEIEQGYPSVTPSTYLVLAGDIASSLVDTLKNIALKVWGDSSLWYLLQDANGFNDGDTLVENQSIIIPNVVNPTHSNDTTFRPYNTADIQIDLTPTLPDPPPPPQNSGGCSTTEMIIVIVVAVVVSVVTAGVATMFIGPALTAALGSVGSAMVIGALAGAASSIASQLTQQALGMRGDSEFSWTDVGIGALSGAITAGIGEGVSAAATSLSREATVATATAIKYAAKVTQAVLGNIATQKLKVDLGKQERIDWRGVAATALASAGSSAVLGDRITSNANQAGASFENAINDSGTAFVQGFAREAANRIVYGSDYKPDWGAVAADALGTALGNAIGAEIRFTHNNEAKRNFDNAGVAWEYDSSGNVIMSDVQYDYNDDPSDFWLDEFYDEQGNEDMLREYRLRDEREAALDRYFEEAIAWDDATNQQIVQERAIEKVAENRAASGAAIGGQQSSTGNLTGIASSKGKSYIVDKFERSDGVKRTLKGTFTYKNGELVDLETSGEPRRFRKDKADLKGEVLLGKTTHYDSKKQPGSEPEIIGTPYLNHESENTKLFLGLELDSQTLVESFTKYDKNGLVIGGSAFTGASATVAEGIYADGVGDPDSLLGEAKFTAQGSVAARAQADAAGNITLTKKEVSGQVSLGAEAVAVKVSGDVAGSVTTFGGAIQATSKIEGDLNLGGVGGNLDVGVGIMTGKEIGIKYKIGGGLTALVGGRVKLSGSFSINTEKAFTAYANYRQTIDNNIQNYASTAYNAITSAFPN